MRAAWWRGAGFVRPYFAGLHSKIFSFMDIPLSPQHQATADVRQPEAYTTTASPAAIKARPPFRPDIEGLRGIAVLLVVLYHAAVPGFTGGYVGVDVFFVLSGYLITWLLGREVEKSGRVDLPSFYARRARRLLPAMGVLLLAIMGFAWLAYSPQEQELIAATAFSTATYLSNVFFAFNATDYLAGAAEANPLLHTWSLAVEEQFYFFWPLLVVGVLTALGRRPASRRRLLWGMGVVSLLSFGLTLYLQQTLNGHWAFFSSPTRAWEFAIGGLGVLLPLREPRRLRVIGGALGWQRCWPPGCSTPHERPSLAGPPCCPRWAPCSRSERAPGPMAPRSPRHRWRAS